MKTILYGIFYFFLTLFFAYIFIKEKDLAKKFDARREKFVNKIVKNEKKVKSFKKILYYVETIGSALILVVIIQRFYIGNFKIPTGSMIPTIEIGDRVFADMVSYKFIEPKRNSIIIFDEPMRDEDFYTKRAMGLPGETIRIQDGSLYINGEKTDFRRYSNNGIGDQEWRIPKKGDKLEIIPAGKYREALENAGVNVDAIVEEAFYKEPFEFFKNLYYGLKHKIFDKLKIKYDINEYVKNVGYSIPNMKKEGYDCDATPGLCIRKYDTQLNAGVKPDEQTDRQSFYYEVCASINVDIPIINRIMPNMRLFQVCGDTKQIVLTQ